MSRHGAPEARAAVRAPGRPPMIATQPPTEAVASAATPTPHRDPLQRHREIATMGHDDLRLYAKQIGVRQRDIAELSLDRLRQNCALTVRSLVEQLTE